MLTCHLFFETAYELQINLKITRILLSTRPVKVHIDSWCSMIERPRLFDLLIIIEFEFVELKAISGEMNISLAKRAQISPCNWIEIVCIESLVILNNHLGVALKDLKEDDNVWPADIASHLIDDKLIIPVARVLPCDSHIKELGAHWHQEIDILILHSSCLINQAHRLLISDTRLVLITLGEVLSSIHIHNVNSDKGMHYVLIKLEEACFFNPDLHAKFLLIVLVELIIKSEDRWVPLEHGRRCLSQLTAVAESHGDTVSHWILRLDLRQGKIGLVLVANGSHCQRGGGFLIRFAIGGRFGLSLSSLSTSLINASGGLLLLLVVLLLGILNRVLLLSTSTRWLHPW